MCRLIGYTLFWIAIGMVIELFIESVLISVILVIGLLIVGYNLFLC